MSDPFVGEIRLLPYAFAPYNWAWCNGGNVSIASNPALNAVIGSTWGGDNRTYFQLPNLLNQVAVGVGSAPGDASHTFTLGETNLGSASIPLSYMTIPPHNHSVTAKAVTANFTTTMTQAPVPGASWIGRPITPPSSYYKAYNAGTQDSMLNTATLGPSSTVSQPTPHENRQPYAYVPMCIALAGVFPVSS